MLEIRVDQAVNDSRINQYRFSLAHELAHRVLHQEVFAQMKFSRIEEWKLARSQIGDREYGFIEWHANAWAGYVLVPPADLAPEFRSGVEVLEKAEISIDDAPPMAWDRLTAWLGQIFVVSPAVISKRGVSDHLWTE